MSAVTPLLARVAYIQGEQQVQYIYVSFKVGERVCEIDYRVTFRIDLPLPYYWTRGAEPRLTIIAIDREIDRKFVPAQIDGEQREMIVEYIEQTEALEQRYARRAG